MFPLPNYFLTLGRSTLPVDWGSLEIINILATIVQEAEKPTAVPENHKLYLRHVWNRSFHLWCYLKSALSPCCFAVNLWFQKEKKPLQQDNSKERRRLQQAAWGAYIFFVIYRNHVLKGCKSPSHLWPQYEVNSELAIFWEVIFSIQYQFDGMRNT